MDAYWESVRTKQGNDVVRVRVTVDPATQTMADAIAKLKAMGFDPIIVHRAADRNNPSDHRQPPRPLRVRTRQRHPARTEERARCRGLDQ